MAKSITKTEWAEALWNPCAVDSKRSGGCLYDYAKLATGHRYIKVKGPSVLRVGEFNIAVFKIKENIVLDVWEVKPFPLKTKL